MSRPMVFDPGAIAAPMNETTQDPTSKVFRAWKVSDAEEMTGPRTACAKDNELGTHVWVSGLARSLPIQSSYRKWY